jgi:hypothetical protein
VVGGGPALMDRTDGGRERRGAPMAATPSAQSSGREAPRWLLFHLSPGRGAEHGRAARFQSKLRRTSGGTGKEWADPTAPLTIPEFVYRTGPPDSKGDFLRSASDNRRRPWIPATCEADHPPSFFKTAGMLEITPAIRRASSRVYPLACPLTEGSRATT